MTGCLSLFTDGQIPVLTVPIRPRPGFDFHFISPQRESGDTALPYVYKNLGQSSNGFFRIALSLGTSCKTPSVCLGIGRKVQGSQCIGCLAQPKKGEGIKECYLQNLS